MARRIKLTSGSPRHLDPPWNWCCPKGHNSSTPAGVTLHRCLVAYCSSPTLTPCSADGNPIRKARA